jgi:hypothetical protein
MAETRRQCEATGPPQGLRVTSHLADVSNEADVMRFGDEAANQHANGGSASSDFCVFQAEAVAPAWRLGLGVRVAAMLV